MPRYNKFQYTSGIVLNGDTATELAKHLGYVSDNFLECLRPYHCALYIGKYITDRDEHLKQFNIQTFDLLKRHPITDRPCPEACWMIPTKWDRVKYEIDPETHENTQKVKAAVVATGIPERYLTRFETFPNKEYPCTVINVRPPLRLTFSTSPP